MSRRRSRNRAAPSGANRQERRDRELYQMLAEYYAPEPSAVNGQLNTSAIYYREQLLKLVYARFIIENYPEDWDTDYILEHLFIDGCICITDTQAGVLPLMTGYSGINVFNHPTECVIANPVLGSFRRTIDVDCVLMKLQYNYHGIMPMVEKYAYMLSNCDASIAVNLFNTRVVAIAAAPNEKVASECKEFYDQIAAGNPLVVTDPEVSTAFSFFPVKNAYIAGDVIDLKRDIINEYLTSIGISNTNTQKKERMLTDEINSNNMEVSYYVQNWVDNIEEGVKKSNQMFGLNWSMKLREQSDYMREVQQNVASIIGSNTEPQSKLDSQTREEGGNSD